MTEPSFSVQLLDLLPPIYREKDTTGELETFLRLPGEELDRLKGLADRFPEIFDVDRCDARFLPLLARLVGWPYDPTKDAAPQRRAIREAVEFYRRKSTLPAIRRSLEDKGWEGWIEETFRSAFRLNRRARLNSKRLPGEIFSYGVYRVHSTTPIPDPWSALEVHHPAGTRVFFLTSLQMTGDLSLLLEAYVKRIVWLFASARLREVFTLNQSRLNGPDPLTRNDEGASLLWASRGLFARQGFTSAAVCVRRWEARRPGVRLNTSKLNRERLVYLWVSERVAGFCCRIEVDDPLPPLRFPMRLNLDALNSRPLGQIDNRSCRVLFRKRDFFGQGEHDAPEIIDLASTAWRGIFGRVPTGLELGRSPLNRPEELAPLVMTNSELAELPEDPPDDPPIDDPRPPVIPDPREPIVKDPPDITRPPLV